MSRLQFAAKNIFWGYVANISTMILSFISRTIYIRVLGMTYLGINDLFVNILGVLSFAELGIGVAMNFCFYKPVAEKDIEKIKSLMSLYKKAYRVVALVVAAIGLVFLPFLQYIVNVPSGIGNIYVYYLIFLFNTVSTYLVSYKFSVVNAEQKGYIFSNINIVTNIITTLLQILGLLMLKSFLVFLLTSSIISLLQKVFLSYYINYKYPYLKEKNVKQLTKDELAPIKKNVFGLVWHKLGDVSVHQTDSIIISTFINVVAVGVVSNYNLIITSVSGLLSIVFNGVLAGLGNLVATESVEKQREIFKIYNFLDFWLYGFSTIAFWVLLSPFIHLWLGEGTLIDEVSLALICLNFYLGGQRIAFLNFKTAYGIFYDDQYVVIVVAVLNLVISISMVKLIGLPGVYVGTVIAGMYQSIRRPMIAYERMLGESVKHYFKAYVKYFLLVLVCGVPIYIFSSYFMRVVTIPKFIITMAVVTIVPNLVFYMVFKNTTEFGYLKGLIKKFGGKICNAKQ